MKCLLALLLLTLVLSVAIEKDPSFSSTPSQAPGNAGSGTVKRNPPKIKRKNKAANVKLKLQKVNDQDETQNSDRAVKRQRSNLGSKNKKVGKRMRSTERFTINEHDPIPLSVEDWLLFDHILGETDDKNTEMSFFENGMKKDQDNPRVFLNEAIENHPVPRVKQQHILNPLRRGIDELDIDPHSVHGDGSESGVSSEEFDDIMHLFDHDHSDSVHATPGRALKRPLNSVIEEEPIPHIESNLEAGMAGFENDHLKQQHQPVIAPHAQTEDLIRNAQKFMQIDENLRKRFKIGNPQDSQNVAMENDPASRVTEQHILSAPIRGTNEPDIDLHSLHGDSSKIAVSSDDLDDIMQLFDYDHSDSAHAFPDRALKRPSSPVIGEKAIPHSLHGDEAGKSSKEFDDIMHLFDNDHSDSAHASPNPALKRPSSPVIGEKAIPRIVTNLEAEMNDLNNDHLIDPHSLHGDGSESGVSSEEFDDIMHLFDHDHPDSVHATPGRALKRPLNSVIEEEPIPHIESNLETGMAGFNNDHLKQQQQSVIVPDAQIEDLIRKAQKFMQIDENLHKRFMNSHYGELYRNMQSAQYNHNRMYSHAPPMTEYGIPAARDGTFSISKLVNKGANLLPKFPKLV